MQADFLLLPDDCADHLVLDPAQLVSVILRRRVRRARRARRLAKAGCPRDPRSSPASCEERPPAYLLHAERRLEVPLSP
jgi:hypothetical protein